MSVGNAKEISFINQIGGAGMDNDDDGERGGLTNRGGQLSPGLESNA